VTDGRETRRLLERLLADPDFRLQFDRDPVGTAREAGLHDLAEQLEREDGRPIQALDGRESRSSLAGALAAAAAEGIALFEFAGHAFGADVASAASAYPAGGAWHVDQFGAAGTGGPVVPGTDALLHNSNLVFDANGTTDLLQGRIDPRVVSLLTELSHQHKFVISATISDHSRLTAGGSVSNHYYGRAFDIASIDGQPVNAGNAVAKEIALELSQLDPRIRPSEIGSPWSLPGAAYFSDAAHQNHLHVGYDAPLDPNWQPPPDAVPLAAREQVVAPAPEQQQQQLRAAADAYASDSEDNSDEEDANDGVGDEASDDPSDDTDNENDSGDGGNGNGTDGDTDAPGEGSNGEDANDDNSGDNSPPNPPNPSTPSTPESPDDNAPAAPPPVPGVPVDPGTFPSNDAPPQQIAAWLAAGAQQRGLPAELPVMAALVESGLKNLDHGDADSVGLFQMRASVWNNGAYAGYGQRPELQLKWFLDRAEAVKAQRVAAGLPVNDPQQYGNWIADIERPAEQFRGRYQLRLAEAQALLANGGAAPSASIAAANNAQLIPAVQQSP
jgi:hypothetical protein